MARSVMAHRFSEVPRAEIPRSSFDRSHGHKTTFDGSWLVPIYVDEMLPGDTFAMQATGFVRMSTPLFPVMDNLFLDMFFFFVPYRLVWDNFQRFMGERTDPEDSIDYLVPTITSPVTTGYARHTLGDYFGIRTDTTDITHSALPHRAYALIYNEWFRDQNLQDSLTVDKDDGPDSPGTVVIQRRGKRHDYFTSALPWPQKGDSVDLPLGTTADVYAEPFGTGTLTLGITDGIGGVRRDLQGDPAALFATLTDGHELKVDLSTASAATINQLRQAFQIQKLLERDARGGTRYREIILAHFGVQSPDARLMRPEYLGGSSTRINVTPVSHTARIGNAFPGDQGAYAVGTPRAGFHYSATEHGVVIGLVNARCDLTYQQGTERFWFRQTRYDFFWPALSMIGEQTVLNQEIFTQGTAADTDVWGYQERYAEYRYKPSRISGAFRSDDAASLDAWHLSQDFAALPLLNDTFIVDQPPFDRVTGATEEANFIGDFYFQLRCVRPMPLFGTPGLIDHF